MQEFQLKYGTNPNQKPARIFMADGSELPVTRLAEKCGFSDPAYFSRVFKRIKAVSPRQYIRAHGR